MTWEVTHVWVYNEKILQPLDLQNKCGTRDIAKAYFTIWDNSVCTQVLQLVVYFFNTTQLPASAYAQHTLKQSWKAPVGRRKTVIQVGQWLLRYPLEVQATTGALPRSGLSDKDSPQGGPWYAWWGGFLARKTHKTQKTMSVLQGRFELL